MNSEAGGDAGILRRIGMPDLAYRHADGLGPTVMFCGGFTSDMTGTKAVALHRHCAGRGWAFLRFDYSGHGASGGRFADGSVGRWAEDAVAVLDAVAQGPVILVGSSMGAWVAVLMARERPERIAGLVTVAAAPDFTEELIWPSLGPQDRTALEGGGTAWLRGAEGLEPAEIGWNLIEDGRRRRVLGDRIPFAGPVRLLHGLGDGDVPWQTSVRLAEALQADDVEVLLVKGGDHRLSTPQDLARLFRVVDEVRERAGRR